MKEILDYFRFGKKKISKENKSKLSTDIIEKINLEIEYYFKINLLNYYERKEWDIRTLGINLIETKYSGNFVNQDNWIIKINLSRPGLIIGKAGRQIKEIEEDCLRYIESIINQRYSIKINIDIFLVEFDPLKFKTPEHLKI